MKSLHNLSIKKKFAVVIIPLILIIIIFDYFQVQHKYLDYHDSFRLNKAIVVGVEINHAVHELQKERGISAGFLSSDAAHFSRELLDQRRVTDSTINEFYKEIDSPQLEELTRLHAKDIAYLKTYFERIAGIRDQIDAHSVTANEAIDQYSQINKVALNTVNMLINETRDKSAAQQVHAIINFLKAKENASIERAIGTQAYALSEMNVDLLKTFSTLIAEQGAYIDAFLTIADKKSTDFYNETVSGQDINEVDRLREVLSARGDLEEDPYYWYQVITNKINAMKRVEDYMSNEIQAYTKKEARGGEKSFWSFLLFDLLIGAGAFILMTYIVSNLIENVATLEDFTKKLSAGDLSKKVNINSKDEIGQYAETFNRMLDEISSFQQALKDQKRKAEHLYENIYKQSEVIFENVEQGVFLLDKEFRIGSFYSKAMEKIFNNKIIANEHFSSFMRSLIIPRDLEALEMFMRHLFNPDMDEDVVNQLNPIEQVKIYTEDGGVVNTKYIRVSFSRIERESEIQNIMVTISDETESVLFHKHMEEAETRKQQETELMLSILKIDPALLRGFLKNSRKILKGISEKYEQHEGQEDFKDLLEFTFQSVHNIKGNSVLIGVKLITDKLHDIEESVTALKTQSKISGNDFLNILYEIDEVDKIIADMKELLLKVADVYRKFPSQGHVVSNILVIDSLERGLNMMSKELGKDVNFTFTNDNNVVIPEHYTTPFKDIIVQLMRNSLSHGIENPNVRVGNGKLIRGTISISLDQSEEDEMVITYRDDGQGLDMSRIKEKAVSLGLISELEASDLSKEQAVTLLFSNGFSTYEKVDNYAGRGEGLPLVKTILDDKNGSFKVDFKKGQYFEIVFRLPLANRDKPEEAA